MPYKDKQKQLEYQRKWVLKRRQDWLAKNGPCTACGSWERLEVDHIDQNTKVSHRVWSWSESRRNLELAKCQVLCWECHKDKTTRDRMPEHGTETRYVKYQCRCSECREGRSVRRRAERQRQRAKYGTIRW